MVILRSANKSVYRLKWSYKESISSKNGHPIYRIFLHKATIEMNLGIRLPRAKRKGSVNCNKDL